MNNTVWDSFIGEIEKIAGPMGKPTYPISRLLTSRKAGVAAGGVRAIEGLSKGNPAAAIEPLLGGMSTHVDRWVGARGTRGRMAKGGKSLWGFEKKRLAEIVGVSEKRLGTLIKRVANMTGKDGGKTFPISRFLTHSLLPPQNIISRFVGARGMAGRVAKGNKHMLHQEKELINALKKANTLKADVGGIGRGIKSGAKSISKHRPKGGLGNLVKKLQEHVPA